MIFKYLFCVSGAEQSKILDLVYATNGDKHTSLLWLTFLFISGHVNLQSAVDQERKS
jgi:hypothetical protein